MRVANRQLQIGLTIALAFGWLAVATHTQAAESSSVARDRMAIEETLRRYVRALDDSDLPAYLATLTDDAKFVAAEGSYAGIDKDHVVVRAYWMFVVAHGADKPMSIDIMGSSEDYLRRSGATWLIHERRVAP